MCSDNRYIAAVITMLMAGFGLLNTHSAETVPVPKIEYSSEFLKEIPRAGKIVGPHKIEYNGENAPGAVATGN